MNGKNFEGPFFIGLLSVATIILGYIFFPYLNAIVIAIVLAIFFHPVYLVFLKIMPNWKKTASFLTVIFSSIAILIPFSFFGYQIFQESQDLYRKISTGNSGVFVDFLNSQLKTFLPWLKIDFASYLEQILGTIVGSLGEIFEKVASTTIMVFLALFAFYYFLRDAKKLEKLVLKYIPLNSSNSQKVLANLLSMASSVIKGSLIIGVVQGFLVGTGFIIFGLSNPVLWGSVAIFASLVPILGVGIVVIPGIASLFLSGNMTSAIGFTIWSVLIVGLADNFLRPILIERDVHVHPLLVFLSVLGGLAIFGATGLLLGPLALSLFLALMEIYPAVIKKKKV